MPRKNTKLARQIARIYEKETGHDFPGGVENACIGRTYAGHWQRSNGAWSWFLEVLDTDKGHILSFGSPYPASDIPRFGYVIHRHRRSLDTEIAPLKVKVYKVIDHGNWREVTHEYVDYQ